MSARDPRTGSERVTRARFARPVRVPLQTGASSLTALLFSLLGATFVVFGLGSCEIANHANASGDAVGKGVLLFFAVVGTAVGALTMGLLAHYARKRRASDIVFDSDGVAIEGGAFHGRSWTWGVIDPSQSEITTDQSEYVEINGKRTYARKLAIDGFVVAVSSSEEEQRSFAAVLDAVRAGASKGAPVTPAPKAAQVLACGSCGAAVVPTDAPSVPCRYCAAPVAVSDELRERVRAARGLAVDRARSDAMVGRVLRQPGASRTNVFLSMTALALYVASPVALGLVVSAHPNRALVAVAFVLLAITFVRADIASRKALRALVTGFAARAPAREGEPCSCRRCAAPLPDATDAAVVVRCVYCQAANVLGLELRAEAASAKSDESELESALAARRKESVVRVGLVLVCVALVAVAVAREAAPH